MPGIPTRSSAWQRLPLARARLERAQDFYLRVLEADPGDVTAQAALINLRAKATRASPKAV
jgi:hypothetical protein